MSTKKKPQQQHNKPTDEQKAAQRALTATASFRTDAAHGNLHAAVKVLADDPETALPGVNQAVSTLSALADIAARLQPAAQHTVARLWAMCDADTLTSPGGEPVRVLEDVDGLVRELLPHLAEAGRILHAICDRTDTLEKRP